MLLKLMKLCERMGSRWDLPLPSVRARHHPLRSANHNSSSGTMRPPYYPFLEKIVIQGVLHGSVGYASACCAVNHKFQSAGVRSISTSFLKRGFVVPNFSENKSRNKNNWVPKTSGLK